LGSPRTPRLLLRAATEIQNQFAQERADTTVSAQTDLSSLRSLKGRHRSRLHTHQHDAFLSFLPQIGGFGSISRLSITNSEIDGMFPFLPARVVVVATIMHHHHVWEVRMMMAAVCGGSSAGLVEPSQEAAR
jgi:hypothetical protein